MDSCLEVSQATNDVRVKQTEGIEFATSKPIIFLESPTVVVLAKYTFCTLFENYSKCRIVF